MDDLYTFDVPGGVLVASPLRSVFAFVNAAAAGALARGESRPELHALQEALASPARAPDVRGGALRPAFLGIIPTRSCNLACVYCGFGAPTAPAQRMPVETAVAAVDWMAETVRAAGERTLEVHFFGGEPLAAGEVVDAAVHRARIVAAELDLTPRFEISTNGVCSESRAQFLGDYFDAVVLSLDGPREIQDRQRPMRNGGSFDAVVRTAHILSESSAELCLRTCVTRQSVAALEETVRWFCQTFRPNVINVETLQPTAQSDAAGLAPPDPHEFARHCVRAMRVARAYGAELTYSAADMARCRDTSCPLGRDAVMVSPDGSLSGCYLLPLDWKRRGLDLHIGAIDAGGGVTVDTVAVERLRRMVAAKPARCADCFCRYWCAGGCHVNHSYPGCADGYDDFCTQTRLITGALLLERLGAGAEVLLPGVGDGGESGETRLMSGPLAMPSDGRWPRHAVTLRGVIAFGEGVHRVLDGAEAALWDLLGRGYATETATSLVAAIARIAPAEAQRLIRRWRAEWAEAGVVEAARG